MKTRQMTACVLVLAMSVIATSCAQDFRVFSSTGSKKVTDVRDFKGFEKIEIDGSPTVYYTQADSFSVCLKGTESSIDNIDTYVKGKTLVVRNKGKFGILNISIGNDTDVEVYVTSPDLTSICLNGSGDFISKKQIDSDDMLIALHGSGDLRLEDVICDKCTTELIGSGDIDVNKLDTRVSLVSLIGSGDIELKQRNVKTTEISLKGSGDISVQFGQGCHSVSCQLQGSGDIDLSGHVKQLHKQKQGSGDIDIHKLTVEK